jgi:hypothetical protein
MPYLTLHNSSTIIRSRLKAQGLEAVISYQRSWTLTQIDSFVFTVLAPTSAIQAGQKYDIWADQKLTRKLGTVYVINPGGKAIKNHPLAEDGNEIIVYQTLGVGPTAFLKRKLMNIRRSNITLGQLAKEIILKAGSDYGLSMDFSYVQPVSTKVNVEYINMTAFDMFERLRDLGTAYYVDDDYLFHFFEDEGEVLGYSWDDNTGYLKELPLNVDISDLRNAVKITGADKVKTAPDFTIVGTGDLTTGLDYNLPHNVKFSDDLLLEDWTGIDESAWLIGDSMGSTSPLSPDGSRIFLGNSSIHLDGGSGVQGPNIIQRQTSSERTEGNALVQTMSFGNFGNGFVLAFGDGNGGADTNLMGFYLQTSGQLIIKEKGTTYTPSPTISVKRSFGEEDNITISGISTDRKTFTVPTGIGAFFAVNGTIQLFGNSIGLIDSPVTNVAGNNLTIADAIPNVDTSDVKLVRSAVYRLLITQKEIGFTYQIQGEQYGSLNSSIYTTVYNTSADDTEFLYAIPAAPKDATCILDIEDTFINPSGGVKFVRDGVTLLAAPEDQGQNFDFPVLIRPADLRKNPPLFRYRPSRLIATVDGGMATTTHIPLSESDFDSVFLNDRLLINKQETFVTATNISPFSITISPALSSAPADGDFIYVGTSAAANGQNGVLSYSYPVSNRRFLKDDSSIALYGLNEDVPIVDQTLKTSDDISARWEAFKQSKAKPKVVGSTSFSLSPVLDV